MLVATSRDGPLLNHALLAMLFTRARDHTELITDALDKFAHRAAGQTGEKTLAIEVAGQPVRLDEGKPERPRPTAPQRELDISSTLGRARERDFER